MPHRYDIIIVGGGHAGAEAAWVAAQLGASVAMITMSREAIGRMSCNPAIGGLGKGQIVREIDALGGLMGLATDRAGVHFRMLNRSKGPAVWAPRAQCDRHLYPRVVQDLLATARNFDIVEGAVETLTWVECSGSHESYECPGGMAKPAPCGRRHAEHRWGNMPAPERTARAGRSGLGMPPPSDTYSSSQEYRVPGKDMATQAWPCHPSSGILAPSKRVSGVVLKDGRVLRADSVILTTGTFLRGLMHCGTRQTEGGRIGEDAAAGLSACLKEMGFTLGRLKTGTPPRVHRDTVNYDLCQPQPPDDVPLPLSYLTDVLPQPQLDCWITWTNENVHEHIRANLHRAPMYSGQIQSTGPRYCPSIEDKVVRFAQKDRHQVFLEPEGYDNERIYCNGISTSLPEDAQDAFVREVRGLERARILQPGYAVEYDFVPTSQTTSSLETKLVDGLFLAGQINGTSGYEEAAGQGLIAGVNAVMRLRGAEPLAIGRDEAYIGVMLDDLITRPPTEPYRMFTSRAEYRLLLRADNADQRLTPMGRRLGTVDDERWERFERKSAALAEANRLCARASFQGIPLAQWLKRPEFGIDEVAEALGRTAHRAVARGGRLFCVDVLQQLLTDARYSGYVDRQARHIDRFRRLESMQIPDRIDYRSIPELRHEAREQLGAVGPRTLGQAGRIPGVTPADLTVLWVHLAGRRRLQPTA